MKTRRMIYCPGPERWLTIGQYVKAVRMAKANLGAEFKQGGNEMSYHKPQSAREWGEELWAMSAVQRTSDEFGHTAHRVLVQGRQEGFADRMKLMDLCRLAPKAVEMDTIDLHTAVRHLVDFAWKAVNQDAIRTAAEHLLSEAECVGTTQGHRELLIRVGRLRNAMREHDISPEELTQHLGPDGEGVPA